MRSIYTTVNSGSPGGHGTKHLENKNTRYSAPSYKKDLKR